MMVFCAMEFLALRKGICAHVGDVVRFIVAVICAGRGFLPGFALRLPLRTATAMRCDTPRMAQHAMK
jgi:hypothetical protein